MRQIFVDSRDRSSGTSSDFTLTLPQTIALNGKRQGRIDDFRLPVAIPTINSQGPGANNSISINAHGSVHVRGIQAGNISDGDVLANRIFEAIKTISGAWTVAYDKENMQLRIETAGTPFNLTPDSPYSKWLLERPYFRNNDQHYQFLYVPLQGLDMCYLCCPQFSNLDNVGPKGASDVLCGIPITVGFGSVQHYSMSNSVYFDIPASTFQTLSFQLRDRNFNLVNTVANFSFTLTID